MGNIIYKRKQTITGGGSSSIANTTFQGIKSTDFTAAANSIYEVNASCKMTLPSSPSTNDKIRIILSSDVNFDMYTTDKINGALLQTDYVLRITKKDLFFTFVYSGSTNGWVWDTRDNSYIFSQFTGLGVLLTYASNNDTNDLFYYLGTNKGTESWVNPVTRTSLCTISATNWNQNAIKSLTNRSTGLDSEFTQYYPEYTVTLLNNNTFTPNKFVVSAIGMGNNPLPGSMALNVRALSTDPWITVLTMSFSTKEIYYVFNVSTTIKASQIRLSWLSGNGSFPEIYLYGTFYG